MCSKNPEGLVFQDFLFCNTIPNLLDAFRQIFRSNEI